MKKKRLIAVALTGALAFTLLLVYSVSASPTDVLLDSVNIGNPTSETGHNLQDWTNIWSGCSWCGPDGNMRLIWGDGGDTCAPSENWASLTLDAGPSVGKTLRMGHLDGSADDGFNVYVNDTWVGTYTDQYSSETWLYTDFPISEWNFSGSLGIKLEATGVAGGSCARVGQVAFDMIELWGPLALEIDVDSATVFTSESVVLRAELTDADTSAPVSGKTLSFEVTGGCAGSATTDAFGRAEYECTDVPLPVGTYEISVEFAGDGEYGPASGNGSMTVLNQPPISNPNGPYLGAMDAGIGFDGSASSDPDGGPLRHDWDWGDTTASPDAGATPTHAYGAAGIYDVCLTVTDLGGLSDAACTYAVVYDPAAGFVTGGGWIMSPAGAYYPSELPYFDGSYYEIVFSDVPLSLSEARAMAAGLTCANCTSAHLATITSQGEYDAVLGLIGEHPGAGLGGFQDEGVSPPDEGWQWVTGEPFDFETTRDWWLPGEPNDCGVPDGSCPAASEQVLAMYPDGWNDEPYGPRGWYLVEYEDCDPVLTGKATFGFVAKYKKGASVPDGSTEFQFHAGNLNFHSSDYDWLVVTGSNYAKFKGTGTINGQGDYKFQLWAGDGTSLNGLDTFRIKIWYEENGSEVVVYDNGPDQEIGGGSIVVHKAK